MCLYGKLQSNIKSSLSRDKGINNFPTSNICGNHVMLHHHLVTTIKVIALLEVYTCVVWHARVVYVTLLSSYRIPSLSRGVIYTIVSKVVSLRERELNEEGVGLALLSSHKVRSGTWGTRISFIPPEINCIAMQIAIPGRSRYDVITMTYL